MKKGNIIAAVLCLILSGAVIAISAGFPAGRDGVPGPGMVPIIVSVLLAAASITLIIHSLRMAPEENHPLAMFSDDSKRVYLCMGVLIVYVVLLGFLGFLISTVLLLFLFIRWFAKKTYLFSGVYAVVLTALIYSVFRFLLKVPLDFGIL